MVYFYISNNCDVWKPKFLKSPTYKTVGKLKQKHKFKWFHFPMQLYCFRIIIDVFNGDLKHKINKRVGSRNFEERPCN